MELGKNMIVFKIISTPAPHSSSLYVLVPISLKEPQLGRGLKGQRVLVGVWHNNKL